MKIHNGIIADQCKERGVLSLLCHIGLMKDHGGRLRTIIQTPVNTTRSHQAGLPDRLDKQNRPDQHLKAK